MGSVNNIWVAIYPASVAALTLCLYAFMRRRASCHEAELKWDGQAIDANMVSNRVRRVRENYLANIFRSDPEKRRRLVALACRAVLGLDYFRRRQHVEGDMVGTADEARKGQQERGCSGGGRRAFISRRR